MLVSVPDSTGRPRRIANFPCYTYILIQVIGPNTVRIAENDTELIVNQEQGQLTDGIQINAATGIFATWWKGELWAIGSAAFQFILQAPGSQNSVASETASVELT